MKKALDLKKSPQGISALRITKICSVEMEKLSTFLSSSAFSRLEKCRDQFITDISYYSHMSEIRKSDIALERKTSKQENLSELILTFVFSVSESMRISNCNFARGLQTV